MKFTFLMDNKTEDVRCQAEWGLSILIETAQKRILLDTGASGLFAQNAARMGLDLATIDALVISHGHYDHTEGVPAFVAANHTAPIYLHRQAMGTFFGETDGQVDRESCGIRWDRAAQEKILPRVIWTDHRTDIFPGVTLLADLPMEKNGRVTERFWRLTKRDETDETIAYTGFPGKEPAPDEMPNLTWSLPAGMVLKRDRMAHEQALVVEEKGALYVFSGCSHGGVLHILDCIRAAFPQKPIAGLVAGMHLIGASQAVRQEVARGLAAMDLQFVFPVHCTGMAGIWALKQQLGDRCVIASAGDSYAY